MTGEKRLSIELGDRLAKEIDCGVHATFGNMFGLKPKMQPFQVQKECTVQGDISGILSLMQEKSEGTFIVSFPKETIFKVLEKMYRKPFSAIDQSVKSGVGELTNIIYGVMKANLNKDGFAFKMAVPNVVVGENHTIITINSGSTMVVPFTTDLGDFSVLITFHEVAFQKAA